MTEEFDYYCGVNWEGEAAYGHVTDACLYNGYYIEIVALDDEILYKGWINQQHLHDIMFK